MATNWMRWNDTTHVFEKSSDGISFIPVPINASCISEGTLPPAVIPGGGNAPDLAGNNTFTGINSISNATPDLRFIETDQGANLKTWELLVSGSLFYIRPMNDAGVGIANVFSIDRAGQLSVAGTGAPSHNFAGNADGYNILHMVNSSAGASAASGMMFQSNVGDGRGYIIFSGSGNTNPAWSPDALAFYCVGAGGMVLNVASNAPITFRTSNAVRLTIDGAGNATFAGPITFNSNAVVAGTFQVNGGSTLIGSVAMNALSCSTINSNGATVTFGPVNCGAITCTTLNTQNNALYCGPAIVANQLDLQGVAQLTISQINATITIGSYSVVRVSASAGGQSILNINGASAGRVLYLWNSGVYGFTLATGGNISGGININPGLGSSLIYDGGWRPC